MSRWDPRMQGFRQRAEVAFVEQLLADRVGRLDAVECPVAEAAGRVLAENSTSPVDVPSFDRSAMDGYALRAAESFGASENDPIDFKVIGESLPGRPFSGSVGSGQAVRIMTGAPVPEGADAVIMAEMTRSSDDAAMEVVAPVAPSKNVSRCGEDVTSGEVLLPEGRRLRPQDASILVSVGTTTVSVTRQPRIDILPTGSELIPEGQPPQAPRIVDSNSSLLRALVERDGGIAIQHDIVPDDRAQVEAAIDRCEGDVILLTGGSSVGQEDFVPLVVEAKGELPVHGVALRPASPLGVGFLGERPVFLLPGNPVSCLCGYDFFAGPTVRALGGRSRAWPYRTQVLPLAQKLTSVTGRVDYARVMIEDNGVRPLRIAGASILSSTTKADGFVIVPQDLEGFDVGEAVEVHLYG